MCLFELEKAIDPECSKKKNLGAGNRKRIGCLWDEAPEKTQVVK